MKVATPRTLEAATALAARLGELDAAIGAAEVTRGEQVAAIDAATDVVVAPLAEERTGIVDALEKWWGKSGAALTGGARKSIELGGYTIGTRTGAGAVAFAGGDDKAALAAALASPLKKKLTAVKAPTLDRKAIAALLKAGGATAEKVTALGFSIAAGVESFFVSPR